MRSSVGLHVNEFTAYALREHHVGPPNQNVDYFLHAASPRHSRMNKNRWHCILLFFINQTDVSILGFQVSAFSKMVSSLIR